MKINEIKNYTIASQATIKDALRKINDFSDGQALVLFVINDKNQVVGSLTDGDIRRGLLIDFSTSDTVDQVMNKKFHFLKSNYSVGEVKKLKEEDLKIVPIIDDINRILNIVNFKYLRSILPIDAVIMAGGKGTRLHPYTKDIPKPLLELNKKPIIAHNIDRLISYGVKNFYVSVNHMKEQIIEFLDKYYKNHDISIKYIIEDQPLGTMGSVGLIKDYHNDDLLVINADILTNIDFEDFYTTYKDHSDDMSIAAFNVRINIPYAVLQTTDKVINSFIEKPTYIYHSNAGIYLFKKKFINLIKKDKQYDAIDLMNSLINDGKKVTHFPIRGYWLDIGNLENYKKAQDDIRYVKF